jgi:hypothetical protein
VTGWHTRLIGIVAVKATLEWVIVNFGIVTKKAHSSAPVGSAECAVYFSNGGVKKNPGV